jgi:hypothetical protein
MVGATISPTSNNAASWYLQPGATRPLYLNRDIFLFSYGDL